MEQIYTSCPLCDAKINFRVARSSSLTQFYTNNHICNDVYYSLLISRYTLNDNEEIIYFSESLTFPYSYIIISNSFKSSFVENKCSENSFDSFIRDQGVFLFKSESEYLNFKNYKEMLSLL